MNPKLYAVKYSRALKFSSHEGEEVQPAPDGTPWTDHHEQERQAFETAIDANPLEAHNHLVYADWLQENGHDDEAAFRRAMGNWFNSYANSALRRIPLHRPEGWNNRLTSWGMPPDNYAQARHTWRVYVGRTQQHGVRLPEGVNPADIPLEWVGGNHQGREPHRAANDATNHLFNNPDHLGSLYWTNYRGMEESLRQAFMANRNRNK